MKTLFSLFLLVTVTFAVDLCLDSSLPVERENLTFCRQFRPSTCCSGRDVRALRQEFLLETELASERCQELYQIMLCSFCDPSVTNILATQDVRRFPAQLLPTLGKNFCYDLYEACAAEIRDMVGWNFGSYADATSFCNDHTNPNALYYVTADEGRYIPGGLEQVYTTQSFTNITSVKYLPSTSLTAVAEMEGLITLYTQQGLVAGPLIDLSERIDSDSGRGVYDIAFHPNFITNRVFYVFYVSSDSTLFVSQFNLHTEGPADVESEVVILDVAVDERATNLGGWLDFDSEGYLYIAVGDGTGFSGPLLTAQNTDNPLGKVLRVAVDPFAEPVWSIPTDNPFWGAGNIYDQRIFAFGLRNPAKCAFDSVGGELYCGDRGEGYLEEVNIILSGANYGWSMMEGDSCFPNTEGEVGVDCNALDDLSLPLFSYPRFNQISSGASIAAGVVYRGDVFPELTGSFIFVDAEPGSVMRASLDGNTVEKLFDFEGIRGVSQNFDDGQLYFWTADAVFVLEPRAECDYQLDMTASSINVRRRGAYFRLVVRADRIVEIVDKMASVTIPLVDGSVIIPTSTRRKGFKYYEFILDVQDSLVVEDVEGQLMVKVTFAVADCVEEFYVPYFDLRSDE